MDKNGSVTDMSRRRMKVSGIDAVATVSISVLAALWVVQAGSAPTGAPIFDAILVFTFAGLVVWTGASAPWWAGVATAAVGAALAPTWLPLVLSGLAVVGGLAIGVAKRSLPWSRALVAGAALQALARLGNVGQFGVSAAIAVTMSGVLLVFGLQRRPRRERKITWVALGGYVTLMFLSVVGLAVAAASARPELENGNRLARQGISELGQGDFKAAQATFERAADLFEAADADFGQVWSQPARLIPVLAQNRNAAGSSVSGAASSIRSITNALAQIDLDALRLTNGRIDLDLVRRLEQPIEQLNATLDQLDVTVAGVGDNPWVVQPIRRRLDNLRADIAKQRVRGADALNVVRQAPAMLGGDGKRVYFIAFLTPAEARGGGGFMGNWAELTIDNGTLKMTRFGRHTDLNEAGDPEEKRITGPAGWVDHWGPYGLVRANGTATTVAWSNLTISPNFPDTAQVISQLYPQSGGRRLDGVISMDVFALATLLEITGPIDVKGLDEPLASDNAVEFLLRGQYQNTDFDNRVDMLASVAETTVNTLFRSTLPSPPNLAKLLAPLAAEGRLMAWASRDQEEQIFRRANMSGALPELGGGDGFTFALNNGGGNKIDAYLQGDASYVVTTNPATGQVHATATLILRNTAPADGLPDYVIANQVDLPMGYSNLFVSIYSGLRPTSMKVDDEPVDFRTNEDGDYGVASDFVPIPPGDSVKITVEFEGHLDLSGGYRVIVRSPPLAETLPIKVEADGVALGEIDNPSISSLADATRTQP